MILKDQNHKRIVPRLQYYPLIYIFYNDLTAEHLEYKKVLQKLMERYYWSEMVKNVNQYIQVYYQYQIKKSM